MAGLRLDEGHHSAQIRAQIAEIGRMTEVDSTFHYSDDERSLAADSWSVKSEYGSILDVEDQRQNDPDCLGAPSFRTLDSGFDKDDQDLDIEHSMLGLQSHWDAAYAEDLTNFYEHGDAGEIWFGEAVMETMALWAFKICGIVAAGLQIDSIEGLPLHSIADADVFLESFMRAELANWNVLDIGTGNGVLLHALAKLGFVDLLGIDYSEGAIELAKAVANRSGYNDIKFMVDDILETRLTSQFKLVTDKGTLDAVGLHPEGSQKRLLYWKAIARLVAPGGVFVITSCNYTKDELVDEACSCMQSPSVGTFYLRGDDTVSTSSTSSSSSDVQPVFHLIDYVRTYPTFRFGGVEGTKVSTVAFIRTAV